MRTEYDVIIIGSGAAGSVMAYETIRRHPNLSIAVLERGRRENPQAFEHDVLEMMARLYKQGGLQTTKDLVLIRPSASVLPITAASSTAGCCISVASTSKGET